MQTDVKFLKRLNNSFFKWLMITYIALLLILGYKIYQYTSAYDEIISNKLKLFFFSIKEMLDALDGWAIFWMVIFVFIVGTMICHYLQRKIVEQGGSLLDEDE